MLKTILLSAAVAVASLATVPAFAQQPQPPQTKAPAPQTPLPTAGPGEKVCQHRFPDGTQRAWVCKQAEPCCAWDDIRYVKCGSPTFRCL
jgi:hypothetical protein